jgi:hypothetical protein
VMNFVVVVDQKMEDAKKGKKLQVTEKEIM